MIVPIVIIGRTAALYDLSAYYMIPFHPFVAISVASLCHNLLVKVSELLPHKIKTIAHFLFVCILMSILSVAIIQGVVGRFDTGIEHFLINANEGRQIQDYMIDYAKRDDLIIVSPTLAWAINANVTDYQLAIVSHGFDAVHFPATLFPDRFAFGADYRDARYAIVDTLWRDWGAVHMPAVTDMLEHIHSWELVYETSTVQIYRNPET